MVLYVCGALMFVSRNLISNLVFLTSLHSLRPDETPAGTTTAQYPTFDIEVWGLSSDKCYQTWNCRNTAVALRTRQARVRSHEVVLTLVRQTQATELADDSMPVGDRTQAALVRGKGSFVKVSVTYYLSSRTSQPRILLQFHMLRTCGTSSICVSSGAGPCEYH
jgi:hypothetical protein